MFEAIDVVRWADIAYATGQVTMPLGYPVHQNFAAFCRFSSREDCNDGIFATTQFVKGLFPFSKNQLPDRRLRWRLLRLLYWLVGTVKQGIRFGLRFYAVYRPDQLLGLFFVIGL